MKNKLIMAKRNSFTLLEITLVILLCTVVLGLFTTGGMQLYRKSCLHRNQRTVEDLVDLAKVLAIVNEQTVYILLQHENDKLYYELQSDQLPSYLPGSVKHHQLTKIQSLKEDNHPVRECIIVATPWGLKPFGSLVIQDTYGQEMCIAYETNEEKNQRYPEEIFSPY